MKALHGGSLARRNVRGAWLGSVQTSVTHKVGYRAAREARRNERNHVQGNGSDQNEASSNENVFD